MTDRDDTARGLENPYRQAGPGRRVRQLLSPWARRALAVGAMGVGSSFGVAVTGQSAAHADAPGPISRHDDQDDSATEDDAPRADRGDGDRPRPLALNRLRPDTDRSAAASPRRDAAAATARKPERPAPSAGADEKPSAKITAAVLKNRRNAPSKPDDRDEPAEENRSRAALRSLSAALAEAKKPERTEAPRPAAKEESGEARQRRREPRSGEVDRKSESRVERDRSSSVDRSAGSRGALKSTADADASSRATKEARRDEARMTETLQDGNGPRSEKPKVSVQEQGGRPEGGPGSRKREPARTLEDRLGSGGGSGDGAGSGEREPARKLEDRLNSDGREGDGSRSKRAERVRTDRLLDRGSAPTAERDTSKPVPLPTPRPEQPPSESESSSESDAVPLPTPRDGQESSSDRRPASSKEPRDPEPKAWNRHQIDHAENVEPGSGDGKKEVRHTGRTGADDRRTDDARSGAATKSVDGNGKRVKISELTDGRVVETATRSDAAGVATTVRAVRKGDKVLNQRTLEDTDTSQRTSEVEPTSKIEPNSKPELASKNGRTVKAGPAEAERTVKAGPAEAERTVKDGPTIEDGPTGVSESDAVPLPTPLPTPRDGDESKEVSDPAPKRPKGADGGPADPKVTGSTLADATTAGARSAEARGSGQDVVDVASRSGSVTSTVNDDGDRVRVNESPDPRRIERVTGGPVTRRTVTGNGETLKRQVLDSPTTPPADVQSGNGEAAESVTKAKAPEVTAAESVAEAKVGQAVTKAKAPEVTATDSVTEAERPGAVTRAKAPESEPTESGTGTEPTDSATTEPATGAKDPEVDAKPASGRKHVVWMRDAVGRPPGQESKIVEREIFYPPVATKPTESGSTAEGTAKTEDGSVADRKALGTRLANVKYLDKYDGKPIRDVQDDPTSPVPGAGSTSAVEPSTSTAARDGLLPGKPAGVRDGVRRIGSDAVPLPTPVAEADEKGEAESTGGVVRGSEDADVASSSADGDDQVLVDDRGNGLQVKRVTKVDAAGKPITVSTATRDGKTIKRQVFDRPATESTDAASADGKIGVLDGKTADGTPAPTVSSDAQMYVADDVDDQKWIMSGGTPEEAERVRAKGIRIAPKGWNPEDDDAKAIPTVRGLGSPKDGTASAAERATRPETGEKVTGENRSGAPAEATVAPDEVGSDAVPLPTPIGEATGTAGVTAAPKVRPADGSIDTPVPLPTPLGEGDAEAVPPADAKVLGARVPGAKVADVKVPGAKVPGAKVTDTTARKAVTDEKSVTGEGAAAEGAGQVDPRAGVRRFVDADGNDVLVNDRGDGLRVERVSGFGADGKPVTVRTVLQDGKVVKQQVFDRPGTTETDTTETTDPKATAEKSVAGEGVTAEDVAPVDSRPGVRRFLDGNGNDVLVNDRGDGLQVARVSGVGPDGKPVTVRTVLQDGKVVKQQVFDRPDTTDTKATVGDTTTGSATNAPVMLDVGEHRIMVGGTKDQIRRAQAQDILIAPKGWTPGKTTAFETDRGVVLVPGVAGMSSEEAARLVANESRQQGAGASDDGDDETDDRRGAPGVVKIVGSKVVGDLLKGDGGDVASAALPGLADLAFGNGDGLKTAAGGVAQHVVSKGVRGLVNGAPGTGGIVDGAGQIAAGLINNGKIDWDGVAKGVVKKGVTEIAAGALGKNLAGVAGVGAGVVLDALMGKKIDVAGTLVSGAAAALSMPALVPAFAAIKLLSALDTPLSPHEVTERKMSRASHLEKVPLANMMEKLSQGKQLTDVDDATVLELKNWAKGWKWDVNPNVKKAYENLAGTLTANQRKSAAGRQVEDYRMALAEVPKEQARFVLPKDVKGFDKYLGHAARFTDLKESGATPAGAERLVKLAELALGRSVTPQKIETVDRRANLAGVLKALNPTTTADLGTMSADGLRAFIAGADGSPALKAQARRQLATRMPKEKAEAILAVFGNDVAENRKKAAAAAAPKVFRLPNRHDDGADEDAPPQGSINPLQDEIEAPRGLSPEKMKDYVLVRNGSGKLMYVDKDRLDDEDDKRGAQPLKYRDLQLVPGGLNYAEYLASRDAIPKSFTRQVDLSGKDWEEEVYPQLLQKNLLNDSDPTQSVYERLEAEKERQKLAGIRALQKVNSERVKDGRQKLTQAEVAKILPGSYTGPDPDFYAPSSPISNEQIESRTKTDGEVLEQITEAFAELGSVVYDMVESSPSDFPGGVDKGKAATRDATPTWTAAGKPVQKPGAGGVAGRPGGDEGVLVASAGPLDLSGLPSGQPDGGADDETPTVQATAGGTGYDRDRATGLTLPGKPVQKPAGTTPMEELDRLGGGSEFDFGSTPSGDLDDLGRRFDKKGVTYGTTPSEALDALGIRFGSTPSAELDGLTDRPGARDTGAGTVDLPELTGGPAADGKAPLFVPQDDDDPLFVPQGDGDAPDGGVTVPVDGETAGTVPGTTSGTVPGALPIRGGSGSGERGSGEQGSGEQASGERTAGGRQGLDRQMGPGDQVRYGILPGTADGEPTRVTLSQVNGELVGPPVDLDEGAIELSYVRDRRYPGVTVSHRDGSHYVTLEPGDYSLEQRTVSTMRDGRPATMPPTLGDSTIQVELPTGSGTEQPPDDEGQTNVRVTCADGTTVTLCANGNLTYQVPGEAPGALVPFALNPEGWSLERGSGDGDQAGTDPDGGDQPDGEQTVAGQPDGGQAGQGVTFTEGQAGGTPNWQGLPILPGGMMTRGPGLPDLSNVGPEPDEPGQSGQRSGSRPPLRPQGPVVRDETVRLLQNIAIAEDLAQYAREQGDTDEADHQNAEVRRLWTELDDVRDPAAPPNVLRPEMVEELRERVTNAKPGDLLELHRRYSVPETSQLFPLINDQLRRGVRIVMTPTQGYTNHHLAANNNLATDENFVRRLNKLGLAMAIGSTIAGGAYNANLQNNFNRELTDLGNNNVEVITRGNVANSNRLSNAREQLDERLSQEGLGNAQQRLEDSREQGQQQFEAGQQLSDRLFSEGQASNLARQGALFDQSRRYEDLSDLYTAGTTVFSTAQGGNFDSPTMEDGTPIPVVDRASGRPLTEDEVVRRLEALGVEGTRAELREEARRALDQVRFDVDGYEIPGLLAPGTAPAPTGTPAGDRPDEQSSLPAEQDGSPAEDAGGAAAALALGMVRSGSRQGAGGQDQPDQPDRSSGATPPDPSTLARQILELERQHREAVSNGDQTAAAQRLRELDTLVDELDLYRPADFRLGVADHVAQQLRNAEPGGPSVPLFDPYGNPLSVVEISDLANPIRDATMRNRNGVAGEVNLPENTSPGVEHPGLNQYVRNTEKFNQRLATVAAIAGMTGAFAPTAFGELNRHYQVQNFLDSQETLNRNTDANWQAQMDQFKTARENTLRRFDRAELTAEQNAELDALTRARNFRIAQNQTLDNARTAEQTAGQLFNRTYETNAQNNAETQRENSNSLVRDILGLPGEATVSLSYEGRQVSLQVPPFADVGESGIENPVLTAAPDEINPRLIETFERVNRYTGPVDAIHREVRAENPDADPEAVREEVVRRITERYGRPIQDAANEAATTRGLPVPGRNAPSSSGSAPQGSVLDLDDLDMDLLPRSTPNGRPVPGTTAPSQAPGGTGPQSSGPSGDPVASAPDLGPTPGRTGTSLTPGGVTVRPDFEPGDGTLEPGAGNRIPDPPSPIDPMGRPVPNPTWEPGTLGGYGEGGPDALAQGPRHTGSSERIDLEMPVLSFPAPNDNDSSQLAFGTTPDIDVQAPDRRPDAPDFGSPSDLARNVFTMVSAERLPDGGYRGSFLGGEAEYDENGNLERVLSGSAPDQMITQLHMRPRDGAAALGLVGVPWLSQAAGAAGGTGALARIVQQAAGGTSGNGALAQGLTRLAGGAGAAGLVPIPGLTGGDRSPGQQVDEPTAPPVAQSAPNLTSRRFDETSFGQNGRYTTFTDDGTRIDLSESPGVASGIVQRPDGTFSYQLDVDSPYDGPATGPFGRPNTIPTERPGIGEPVLTTSTTTVGGELAENLRNLDRQGRLWILDGRTPPGVSGAGSGGSAASGAGRGGSGSAPAMTAADANAESLRRSGYPLCGGGATEVNCVPRNSIDLTNPNSVGVVIRGTGGPTRTEGGRTYQVPQAPQTPPTRRTGGGSRAGGAGDAGGAGSNARPSRGRVSGGGSAGAPVGQGSAGGGGGRPATNGAAGAGSGGGDAAGQPRPQRTRQQIEAERRGQSGTPNFPGGPR